MSKESKQRKNEELANKLNAVKQSYRDIIGTDAMQENIKFLEEIELKLRLEAADTMVAEECLALTHRAAAYQAAREHIERLAMQP